MIPLLIVGGITGLLALAAHKTNLSPSPSPATPSVSPSAAHPSNSGLEGIFATPEQEQLYSTATAARSYATAPAIPIQPGTRPAPAIPAQLVRLGVRLPGAPAPVAKKTAVLSRPAATPVRTSISRAQRQRFSLL